ncbi:MAG: 4a-hydroxytetrahydrobiopterin dehydratase [Gemmatimonadota bacterium]
MTSTPAPLDPEIIAARLALLPGWSHADGWLLRNFPTDGWRSTMLLVNAIAFLAEAAAHHPDLGVHWGRVEIRLQSHDAGGVTDRDLALATRIERLVHDQPIGWITR